MLWKAWAMEKNIRLCALYPLLPQKVVKKAIGGIFQVLSGLGGTILLIFLFFPALMLFGKASQFAGLALVAFGILAFALCAYELLYFRRYYYAIEGDSLVIRKGVFTLGETTVPFSRIQDVTVVRDFLDKLFGLYSIRVSTANAQSGFYAHIDGLSELGASKIREILLSKMSKARKG